MPIVEHPIIRSAFRDTCGERQLMGYSQYIGIVAPFFEPHPLPAMFADSQPTKTDPNPAPRVVANYKNPYTLQMEEPQQGNFALRPLGKPTA